MHYGVPGMKRPKGLHYNTKGTSKYGEIGKYGTSKYGEHTQDRQKRNNAESTGKKYRESGSTSLYERRQQQMLDRDGKTVRSERDRVAASRDKNRALSNRARRSANENFNNAVMNEAKRRAEALRGKAESDAAAKKIKNAVDNVWSKQRAKSNAAKDRERAETNYGVNAAKRRARAEKEMLESNRDARKIKDAIDNTWSKPKSKSKLKNPKILKIKAKRPW